MKAQKSKISPTPKFKAQKPKISSTQKVKTRNPRISSPPPVRPLLILCLSFLCLTYLFFIIDFIVMRTTSTFSPIINFAIFLANFGFIPACTNLFILPICFRQLLVRRHCYHEPSQADFRFFIIISVLTAITNLVFYLNIIPIFICFTIAYPIIAITVKKSRPA